MNKKITRFIAAVGAAALITGCSQSETVGFEKTYWDKNPSSDKIVQVEEKLEYSVAFSSGDAEYVPELSAKGLSFSAGDCSYVATLTVEDGLYVYRTSLKINGEYLFGDDKYTVNGDYLDTEIKFKGIGENFAPVESTRKGKNTTPLTSTPNSEEDFAVGTYEAKTVYDGKSATTSFSAEEGSSSAYNYPVALSPVTVKNYAKKNYIDSGIIALLLRTFSFDKAFTYSFKSIEPISGALESLRAKTLTDSSSGALRRSAIELTSFGGANKSKFTAQGVEFSTEGSYSKTVLYVFYALGKNDSDKDENNECRRYPMKIYQPAIYNSGYFVFTLKSV